MSDKMIIDNETMKMAIALTIKKNVEALFETAQKEPDLLKAAQVYREIATEFERGHAQLEKLEIKED